MKDQETTDRLLSEVLERFSDCASNLYDQADLIRMSAGPLQLEHFSRVITKTQVVQLLLAYLLGYSTNDDADLDPLYRGIMEFMHKECNDKCVIEANCNELWNSLSGDEWADQIDE